LKSLDPVPFGLTMSNQVNTHSFYSMLVDIIKKAWPFILKVCV